MTDRELLELAAKAAGWTGWQSKHGYWNVTSPEGENSTHCHDWNSYCPDTGKKLRQPTFADAIAETDWNPLTDDGDALRLAVKLGMTVQTWIHGYDEFARVSCEQVLVDENHDSDPYAATRKAIVRAAAEICKAQGDNNDS